MMEISPGIYLDHGRIKYSSWKKVYIKRNAIELINIALSGGILVWLLIYG